MLAIAGGKGGTGKTTTALGLATVLGAARGRSDGTTDRPRGGDGGVLVVDADVDVPDLHAMAGVAREPTVLDDADGLAVPGRPGVRVAPAPPADATSAFRDRLSELAASEPASAVREPRLATPDDRSTRKGPFARRVLVDAPCGAGPDAALPMAVATAVVLVTRPTAAAVRDTAKTAAMARALDTPVAAAVIVGRTPNRSLADVFDVQDVVQVPYVDGDPLSDSGHAASMRHLSTVLSAGQTPF